MFLLFFLTIRILSLYLQLKRTRKLKARLACNNYINALKKDCHDKQENKQLPTNASRYGIRRFAKEAQMTACFISAE